MSHRTAIYCRISRDAEQRGEGVERQRTDCLALAEARGWDVAEVFIENDTSATAYREKWEKLLAGLRSGKFTAVVATHPDRLYRSLRSLADFVEVVQRCGAEVATVRAGAVDLSTASGRLTASILGTVAAAEREFTGERTRRALAERSGRGLPHGRYAYGWSRDDRATPDPVAAAVVREAAERMLAGESLTRLADDLNARSLPPPSGTRWTRNKVRDVLRRPANVGDQVRGGQVIGEGTWEPLLDRHTHDRLLLLLSDPARRSTGSPARRHLLSGLARCGVCGQVVWARVTRKALTYRCRNNCVARARDAVDQLVVDVVIARLSRPDAVELLRPASTAELQEARTRLAAVADRAAVVDREFQAGRLPTERWSAMNAALTVERVAAENAVRVASAESPVVDVAGPDAAERWQALPLTRQALIIAALCRVTILPTGRGRRKFDPASVRIEWIEG